MATGDVRYADSAMKIIDAWAATLEGFAGHDQMLAAGICQLHVACLSFLSFAISNCCPVSLAID